MTYTEVKTRKRNKYFYRVISVREGNRVKKKRIYLGANLDKKNLSFKEIGADKLFLNAKIRKNIEKIKPKIIEILKKYKVKRAGLFGSYVRGGQRRNSDIDILIQPAENMSLFGLSELKIELEKILGKKVDLISYKYIHPYLRDRILESEVKII